MQNLILRRQRNSINTKFTWPDGSGEKLEYTRQFKGAIFQRQTQYGEFSCRRWIYQANLSITTLNCLPLWLGFPWDSSSISSRIFDGWLWNNHLYTFKSYSELDVAIDRSRPKLLPGKEDEHAKAFQIFVLVGEVERESHCSTFLCATILRSIWNFLFLSDTKWYWLG